MALPGAQALTFELIPHCTSVLRDGWAGSHDVRPLAELGMRQAQALVASIGGTVDGVYSSPTARCRQTVGPLAAAVGLPVRDLAELYEAWDFGELAGVDEIPDLMVRALGGAWVFWACVPGVRAACASVLWRCAISSRRERGSPVQTGRRARRCAASRWRLWTAARLAVRVLMAAGSVTPPLAAA
jgi:Histidine phosphatase superfamily (branch 1)